MFCNLVNIVAVNELLLFLHSGAAKDQKFIQYCKFREALYMGLFRHSIRVKKATSNTRPDVEHRKIKCKQAFCVMCQKKAQEQQGKKRTTLEELSPNQGTGNRPAKWVTRVQIGYEACNVNLCKDDYWESFHKL